MTRLTIDELEILTQDELGKLLLDELRVRYPESPDIQYIQNLIIAGSPIDFRNSNGQTALHYAVYNVQFEATEFLILSGWDIHARDNNGDTPLRHLFLFAIDIPSTILYKMALLLLSNGAHE